MVSVLPQYKQGHKANVREAQRGICNMNHLGGDLRVLMMMVIVAGTDHILSFTRH